MADLETLQAGQPVRPARAIRDDERAVTLERLAGRRLEIAGTLYLVQQGRCFHCGGAMLFCGDRRQAAMASKEHALPRQARPGNQKLNGAAVLAHRLCNIDRDERAFTPTDWLRAEEIWIAAACRAQEAPSIAQLFKHWAELAREMAWKTGQ